MIFVIMMISTTTIMTIRDILADQSTLRYTWVASCKSASNDGAGR